MGCGRRTEPSLETPEQASERIFRVARSLEADRKTREAFAAYRQIVRYYPGTAHGKKAAERIAQAQRDAMKRAR